MRLNEYDAQGEKHKIMYVILLMLLTVGTAVGSVYLIGRGTETGEVLKEYISGVLSGISDEKNSITVFENSLSSGIVMLLVIFFMGFFRFGCIVTGAIIVRNGFITGFTAASFFKYYGAKGMLIMLSSMPSVIVKIPMLLLFSAVSIIFSLNRSKSGLAMYVFCLLAAAVIFLGASLTEGYITTALMRLIAPRIIG